MRPGLAWNRKAENPKTATPITARQRAQVNLQGRWYRADWLRQRRSVKGCLTLDGIVAGMAAVHGVTVHRGSVGTWLKRPGLSHENTLLASEILRPGVAGRPDGLA